MAKSLSKTSNGFSVIEIAIVVVVLGILSAVVYFYFTKAQQPAQNTTKIASIQQTPSPQKTTPTAKCTKADQTASQGIFCVEDIGLSVQIPDFFKGKIAKTDNYDVYTQNAATDQPKRFGTSELTYEAASKGKNDSYSLIIAIEPLRNFQVRSYVPAMFSKDTLAVTFAPGYGDGKKIETIVLDGITFYKYGEGDAGTLTQTYLGVKNGKIIVLSLVTEQQLGDPATRNYLIDSEKLIDEFNLKIKSFTLTKNT